MHIKNISIAFLFLLVLSIASCSPAVPYNQMPGMDGGNSNYRATADAALAAAQWQEAGLTGTAQAPIIHVTETAAALAMQQQLWTATAQSVQETQIAASTGTAQSISITGTVAAVNAQSTAIANASMRDTLVLERQKNNNAFWAVMGQVAPLLILVLAVGGVLLGYTVIARKQQYQTVEVDDRGNVKPILNVRDGTYTDPDRNPNYRGAVSDALLKEFLLWMLQKRFGFNPSLPQITAARQDATTERDQMIDLATRGLPATSAEQKDMKKLAGQGMMKQLTDSNLQSRFRILDGEANPELGVIDGQIVQVLDNDWQEAEKQ
jgi:hypothetical protein